MLDRQTAVVENLDFLQDCDPTKPTKTPFPPDGDNGSLMWPLRVYATEEDGEKFACEVLDYLRAISHENRIAVLRSITAAQIDAGMYSPAVFGYMTVIADHLSLD